MFSLRFHSWQNNTSKNTHPWDEDTLTTIQRNPEKTGWDSFSCQFGFVLVCLSGSLLALVSSLTKVPKTVPWGKNKRAQSFSSILNVFLASDGGTQVIAWCAHFWKSNRYFKSLTNQPMDSSTFLGGDWTKALLKPQVSWKIRFLCVSPKSWEKDTCRDSYAAASQ